MYKRWQRIQQFRARRQLGVQRDDHAALAALTTYERRQTFEGCCTRIKKDVPLAMTACASDGTSHDLPSCICRLFAVVCTSFTVILQSGVPEPDSPPQRSFPSIVYRAGFDFSQSRLRPPLYGESDLRRREE
jgi:hypothetical protein